MSCTHWEVVPAFFSIEHQEKVKSLEENRDQAVQAATPLPGAGQSHCRAEKAHLEHSLPEHNPHEHRTLQTLRAGLGLCSKSLQEVHFGHNLLAAHA